jgi:FKBP-type peptidyl-prolyl cis-trans isomerase FkpA
MTMPFRAARFASVALLAACAIPSFGTANAAPARKAPAARAVPVAASTAIIPLPLNPVVPAAQRMCAQTTASGLGYTMLKPASGTAPGKDDIALINYIGYLAATGAVFDQNTGAALPVGGVIPGFAEGMMLVPKGGIIRLCIPAALGYGAKAAGPIPANSALVFQVEMLNFKSLAEVQAMRREAEAAEAAGPAAAPGVPEQQPSKTPAEQGLKPITAPTP